MPSEGINRCGAKRHMGFGLVVGFVDNKKKVEQ